MVFSDKLPHLVIDLADVAVRELHRSSAVGLVVLHFAFVDDTVGLSEDACSMPLALNELACVRGTVGVGHVAFSMQFAVFEFPFVFGA